ncbi:MAG: aldehyde dehydrogenase [Archangiaceae bacterium]|nr:aldehyde dehydrogenase [Archangiaceae bacterium]
MTAAVAIPPSTPFPKLDEVVAKVKAGSREFARLSLDERIAMLEAFRDGYRSVALESARAACLAKGLDPDAAVAGEELLGGPMVTIRILRLTAEALREVKQHGAPRIDKKAFRQLADGRWAVKIFPNSAIDGTLLAKHTGEVYLKAGITPDNIKQHQAAFYRQPHQGRLCLVLGAGNVNAIAPTDVVYKMFVEGSACILKMNPVNAYLGPFIERAFAPAIARGFLAVVYGGAEEGAHLVNHPQVDEVHITGSDKTHDAMVWGPPGADAAARRARNEPLLKKDISSELGCITPVIVVPGPYDDAQLGFQGRNIAGMIANNASFNCNSAKLLVTSKPWVGRQALLGKIQAGLELTRPRKAYYPGAEERWRSFVDGRENVKKVGHAGPGELPWAFITDVDKGKRDDRVFTVEPWCALISEVSFDTQDVGSYLDEAVKFVNERVWGTLSTMVVVHPATLKDPRTGAAVEKAIAGLRYGAVAVNTWAGAVFGLGVAPWGAHPSSTLQDIQSGKGWVHNTLLFDHDVIEKFVLRAPVKAAPIHPWFPGHRSADQLAKKLIDFEMGPSWLKVPGIATAAMKA